MIIAFIIGWIFAGIGALLSLAINNWQMSLIFSGTVGVISIVLSSIVGNASLVLKRKVSAGKREPSALEQAEKVGKMIAVLGLPNLVVAGAVYFFILR